MDIKNIKIVPLLWRAFGKYRPHILLAGFLGFLSSIFAGVGIGTMIPLFSFIIGGEIQGLDAVSQFVIRVFSYFSIPYGIISLLAVVILLFIMRAIFLFLSAIVQVRVSYTYRTRTARELIRGLLSASWPYIVKQKLGYLQNTIIQDVHFSGRLLEAIAQVFISIITIVVFIFFAAAISFRTTLLTATLGIIFFLLFRPLLQRTKILEHELTLKDKTINHFLAEHIIGLKNVKTAAVEGSVLKLGEGHLEELRRLGFLKVILRGLDTYSLEPLSVIFISVIFFTSHQTPGFSFPAFVAIIYLIQRILAYIEKALSSLNNIHEAIPHVVHVVELDETLARYSEAEDKAVPFSFERTLAFDNVYFEYERGTPVLAGVSLGISKGEMVGLVGPSGCGKTTVADLILRLLEPRNGSITLDGKDYTSFSLSDWRTRIGYVSQDIFLLNDTMEANIRFYNEKLSREGLVEAAKSANIHDFIQGLPDGFKTMVGDRGMMLSAGQRQRIVFARVLARHPEILILDEATSALDNESEVLIHKAINALKGKITVLVIAHRLSTVIDVDRLLVLGQGRIIEEGRPDRLLADKSSYFYRMHHLKEEKT